MTSFRSRWSTWTISRRSTTPTVIRLATGYSWGAAQALGKSIRSGDMVARYGGEEFVVLLRDCDLVMAETRLSQILEDLVNTRYEYGSGPEKCHIQFTASCGLAEFDSGESADDIVQRSDQALYEAKKRGKNRVAVKKKSLLKGLFGRRSAA